MRPLHLFVGLGLWILCSCDGSKPAPATDAAIGAIDAATALDGPSSFDAWNEDAVIPDASLAFDLDASRDAVTTDASQAAEGEVCGPGFGPSDAATRACGPGLVCCYPCGIPGCEDVCMVPCEGASCSGGCPLVP